MTNTINEQIKALEAKVAEWEKELSIIKSSSITSDSAAELIKKLELAIDDAEWEICDLEAQAGIDIFSKPAVDETTTAEQNTKGEKETMTTVITNTTNTTKGEETMTTTNTTTKQENTTEGANNMNTTYTIANNKVMVSENNKKENVKMTKSAYFTAVGTIIEDNKVAVLNEADLALFHKYTVTVAQVLAKSGIQAPLLSTFIGTGNSHLIADGRRNKFVIVRDGKEASVQFSAPLAKQIIDYTMVILPTIFPGFVETAVYTKLAGMNLKGRLTAKKKAHGKVTRDTVLSAALNMNDIYVVKETVVAPGLVKKQVLGKLMNLKTEFVQEHVVFTNEKGEYALLAGIKFYIAKDTDIANLNSPYSLYQKNSGSLAATRFAKTQGKKLQTVEVVKEYTVNGVAQQIVEEQKAYVLPEMCTFDGSTTLPFGEEINAVILKEVFREVTVVDSKDGKLDVTKEVFCTYNTYVKSMSQARSNGAVGFQTLEQIIDFLIGTGSDATAYGKAVKDSTTGEKVMEVGKAYKRFMLAGSNGLAAKTGLLSRFDRHIKVEETVEFRIGGKKVEKDDLRLKEEGRNDIEKITRITIKNKKKEVITMVIIDDFYSEIKEGQRFIINVLDKSNAFKKAMEFKHWGDATARKEILSRNLTDGGGYISERMIEALRAAGVINSFDAFQLRISNAVKGAVIQFDEICNHYGADIVLTDGMVKSEVITADLEENGFQLYVVGQRKDGAGGNWLASQALQQMGLTKEELLVALQNSITFHIDAIEKQMVDNLLALANASDEESENELASIDFLRLAKEVGDVMDEQYIKDELIGLAVKKLNKLLDSKMFTPQARTRYMFSDPVAIYNAAIEGRHLVTEEDAVLDAYQVICPSIVDGKYVMQTGKALSVRYPVTVIHEIPVVEAIAHPLYAKYVEQGIWQGCTFFDIKSWVVAQQAGADHDGDMSIMIFDPVFVNARIRASKELFGGLEILPFIDAYAKLDEQGNPVVTIDKKGNKTTKGSFGTGCPTYVVPGNKKTEPVETTINDFKVVGTNVFFKDSDFEGENGAARRRDFVEAIALLAKDITLDTIESSLIGLIANRAMVLTDLITQEGALNTTEREFMEEQLLVLTTAGRWEIDRPKHGGAYLEMPIIKELFANFESLFFSKEEMSLTDAQKKAKLVEEKGLFSRLFVEQFSKKTGALYGFKVVKPNWLSTQKDEDGVDRGNASLFEFALNASKEALKTACETLKKKHSSNTAVNNISVLVEDNMEVDARTMLAAKAKATVLYNAFGAKEKVRKNAENAFVAEQVQLLQEAGAFGKKNVNIMTKAKKKAKVRTACPVEMAEFKNGRELHEAQFRKAMYEAAQELQVDVRVMVGALYLVINEQATNTSADWTTDGREFVYVASNGNINLPFTTFKEEMSALVSGKVSKTCFIPMNVSFSLLKSNLIEGVAPAASSAVQVNTNVMAPVSEKQAGNTFNINKNVRVAVKFEEIRGEVRKVMYVLHKDAQVVEADAVTREHAAFVAFATEDMMLGLGERFVSTVKYHATKQTAVITFA